MLSLPKVIVFDLDGTCWRPDMYELWGGGGAPFTVKHKNALQDRGGNLVELLGDTREILEHLMAHPDVVAGRTKLATASTCDEPAWAREALSKFLMMCPRTREQKAMGDVFHHHEIFTAANKAEHFRNIGKKFNAGVGEMIFFDNQRNNIEFVGRMGVRSVFVPDGLTWEAWSQHLSRI